MKAILILALLNFLTISAFSQKNDSIKSAEPRSYKTSRLSSEAPEIDGKLNDACWSQGTWASDFTQWIPNEGAKPSLPTFINIQYDSKNIYVAIRAMDNEPEKISQRAGKRDEFAGDIVGICFDSYHDHRTGFEFDITAAGQKIDAVLTNPMDADKSWDAVWKGKVSMEANAWTAEFEIPLSQLRYSKETQQTWGMHVWRWIDRFQEESDWEVQTSTGPGMLYLFGNLTGIENLPKSRRIEIMPYATGKIYNIEQEIGNPFAEKKLGAKGNIGLDAKIGLSSNFTADVTINPDFGQVESDPSVMNLSAFETFYDEKRPFFLEGKNIFSYEFDDLSLFYSRRIGQTPSYYPTLADVEYMKYPENASIISAVKVSGKSAEGLSAGLLQSVTNHEFAEISNGTNTSRQIVEPLTSYTVARIQQDFNKGNTVIGGILTSTNRLLSDPVFDNMNHNAFTGGVDLLHQWNDKEFYLNAKVVGSSVQGDVLAIQELQNSSARYYQRPDAAHLNYDENLTSLNGQGGKIEIGKGSKGLWRYYTSLSWVSPGLELNDIGFMHSADHVKNQNKISYSINQPTKTFRSLSTSFTQTNNWDYGMNYLGSQFTYNFYGQFLNKWGVSSHVCYFPETLDTRLLRGGNAMKVPAFGHVTLNIESDYSKQVYFSFYTFYESAANSNSESFTLNPYIQYRPMNTLKLSLSANYTTSNNELQYVTKTQLQEQAAYIMGNIDQQTLSMTFRADYNITPELSIQYYGSPYFTVGSYNRFKWVNNPTAEKYTNRFQQLNTVTQENGIVTDNTLSFQNPDFSFAEFRSNLVFRWEYQPGSRIYFVWSNESTNYKKISNTTLGDTYRGLSNVFASNIFLVKLNYWISL